MTNNYSGVTDPEVIELLAKSIMKRSAKEGKPPDEILNDLIVRIREELRKHWRVRC